MPVLTVCRRLVDYLAGLTAGRLVLWCALVWYLVIGGRYLEPDGRLWATAVGIAVLVGTILTINAASGATGPRSLERWTVFRFYLIPFCVSSFSALVKGRDFLLVFPLNAVDNLLAGGACLVCCLLAWWARRWRRPRGRPAAAEE